MVLILSAGKPEGALPGVIKAMFGILISSYVIIVEKTLIALNITLYLILAVSVNSVLKGNSGNKIEGVDAGLLGGCQQCFRIINPGAVGVLGDALKIRGDSPCRSFLYVL